MGNKELEAKSSKKKKAKKRRFGWAGRRGKSKAKLIEKELKALEKKKKPIKGLILGTGDSGKSTFVKQVQLLFSDGFSEKSLNDYKETIRFNLIDHTKRLIEACKVLGIEVEDPDLAEDFLYITEKEPDDDIYETISELWNVEGSALKRAFKQRSKFQIPDSAAYFLDSLERIRSDSYVPSVEDVLKCRIPTLGVITTTFTMGKHEWSIVDVGGQRSERRKWLHQFANVNFLVYVVAVSEYNQNLYEDESVNRITESLELWEQTINNNHFQNKDCVLLFNKFDLFREKVREVDLGNFFPDYTGGRSLERAKFYIKDLFLKKVYNLDTRKILFDWTEATKAKDIRKAFILISEALGLENEFGSIFDIESNMDDSFSTWEEDSG